MPILLPVGVANALNTPAVYTGEIADRPVYNDVQIGTIYIGTDNASIQTATAGGWVALGTGGGGGSQDLQQTLNNGNTTTLTAVFNEPGFITNVAGQYIDQSGNGTQQHLMSCQGALIIDTDTQNNITSGEISVNNVSTFILTDITPGWVYVLDNNTDAFAEIKTTGGVAYLKVQDLATNRQIQVGQDYITFKDLVSTKTQTLLPGTFNNQGVQLPENDGFLALQNPITINVDLSINTYTLNGQKQQTYIIQDVGNDIFLDANEWENNYTVTLLVKSSGFQLTVIGSSSFHGNSNINFEGIYFITYIQADDAFFCSNI